MQVGWTAPLIRIGFARNSDPERVARDALQALGTIMGGSALLMAFCGGKLDPFAVRAALAQQIGPVPIVGGSAAGAISRIGSGYSGFELGLIAFEPPSVPLVLVTYDLLTGEQSAGEELGARVRQVAAAKNVVLLLFDSVASAKPPRLHYASSLLDGFNRGLADVPVHLLGGGLLTDMNLSDAWVYDGGGVSKHAAVALVFPSCIAATTTILHGCRPVSAFMEITRIDGAEVFELDGRPALAVLEDILGLPLGGERGREISLMATLGQKRGDPFAPYDENAYVNRLILHANADAGSLVLFEPDFALGTRVQIMSRDNSLMLESVRRGVALLATAADDPGALMALYVDCAGRASVRSGAAIEEASLVLSGLNPRLPVMGFYSGVEIAPFSALGSRPLDWTGVLTILRSA